uniref:Cytochrome P450 11B, mitochondrial-like n=1 Tax=Oncorhynchus kisutch TaxID=8019 RepID=A0A8C7CSZ0_ONCKI
MWSVSVSPSVFQGIQGMCVSVRQAACVRIQRGMCVCPAGTVAGLGVEGVTPTRGGPAGRGGGRELRRFEEIPHTGSSGWLNLVKFWREDRFKLLHKHMERTFNTLGPFYRERLGTQSTVNILLPSDISELLRSEGLHPRRMTLQPWATHRETRQHSKGVFLKNGAEWRADRLLLNREVMMAPAVRRFLPLLDEVARDFCHQLATRVEKEGGKEERGYSLTIDPSPDLFRFPFSFSALNPSPSSILSNPFSSLLSHPSLPLLSTNTTLLLSLNPSPSSFSQPLFLSKRIQRGVQRLCSTQAAGGGSGGAEGEFTGILGQLMDKGQLSLELIRANITELMAGGVDTVSACVVCVWGRNPAVQEQVRGQVKAAWARAGGDAHKALQGAPLLKGLVKETLRLYPVGITVQRYPVRDIIIQNYHIPAGTCVQACLYPLGRSRDVFQDPELFDPGRWGTQESGEGAGGGGGFRSLARIAENEMQEEKRGMEILLSFRLSVSSSEELSTKYTLILQPETPPRITFSTL